MVSLVCNVMTFAQIFEYISAGCQADALHGDMRSTNGRNNIGHKRTMMGKPRGESRKRKRKRVAEEKGSKETARNGSRSLRAVKSWSRRPCSFTIAAFILRQGRQWFP